MAEVLPVVAEVLPVVAEVLAKFMGGGLDFRKAAGKDFRPDGSGCGLRAYFGSIGPGGSSCGLRAWAKRIGFVTVKANPID